MPKRNFPVTAYTGLNSYKGNSPVGMLGQLEALSPDGYKVYQAIQDKKFFMSWITSGDAQLDLSTAVHESVHHLTADWNAYPTLPEREGGPLGRQLTLPQGMDKFLPPAIIRGQFKNNDLFASTYLTPGKGSSATDFTYLIDELNAYSHDLNTAVKLQKLHPLDQRVDHRDGLLSLKNFTTVYVEEVKRRADKGDPKAQATWNGLQKPEVARTVATLYDQADKVMATSCGIKDFGRECKENIAPRAALNHILELGRQTSKQNIQPAEPPQATVASTPAASAIAPTQVKPAAAPPTPIAATPAEAAPSRRAGESSPPLVHEGSTDPIRSVPVRTIIITPPRPAASTRP